MGYSVNPEGGILCSSHARFWYGSGSVGIVLLRISSTSPTKRWRSSPVVLESHHSALMSRQFFSFDFKEFHLILAPGHSRGILCASYQCSSAPCDSGSR